jgi:hypothetical protein
MVYSSVQWLLIGRRTAGDMWVYDRNVLATRELVLLLFLSIISNYNDKNSLLTIDTDCCTVNAETMFNLSLQCLQSSGHIIISQSNIEIHMLIIRAYVM